MVGLKVGCSLQVVALRRWFDCTVNSTGEVVAQIIEHSPTDTMAVASSQITGTSCLKALHSLPFMGKEFHKYITSDIRVLMHIIQWRLRAIKVFIGLDS